MRAQLRTEHQVKQRVGALVAQQEGVGFVARAAYEGVQAVVDVAPEEVVGDECGHGVTLRSDLNFTGDATRYHIQ